MFELCEVQFDHRCDAGQAVLLAPFCVLRNARGSRPPSLAGVIQTQTRTCTAIPRSLNAECAPRSGVAGGSSAWTNTSLPRSGRRAEVAAAALPVFPDDAPGAVVTADHRVLHPTSESSRNEKCPSDSHMRHGPRHSQRAIARQRAASRSFALNSLHSSKRVQPTPSGVCHGSKR